jgi:hypothetical protein
MSENQNDKSNKPDQEKVNLSNYSINEKNPPSQFNYNSRIENRVQSKESSTQDSMYEKKAYNNPMGNSVNTGKLSKATEKFLQNNYMNDGEYGKSNIE